MNRNFLQHTALFFIVVSWRFVIPIGLQAQDQSFEINYDTLYIKSYSDIFTPRIFLSNKRNAFSVIDKSNDNELNFEPNSPLNIGIGYTYSWFGLNFAFNLPFINNDNELYGKTTRLDAQTNIYTRKFALDLFYQYYKGFYISNPGLYIPDWVEGDPYPIRGDIVSNAIGGTFNYMFNHEKFSYRAVFNFNERQKKSAGSFTVGGGVLVYLLQSDTGLVPNEFLDLSEQTNNLKSVGIGSIYTLGGYAHTFVIHNWYLSLNLGIGFGVSSTSSTFVDESENVSRSRGSFVSEFRGSLGYNNDLFYAGLSWFTGVFGVDAQNDYLLTYSLSKINLYVGYRLYNLFKK